MARLESISIACGRDKGAMVRWLINIAYMSDNVCECSSSVRQTFANEANNVRLITHMSEPHGDARARDSDSEEERRREEEKKKKKEESSLIRLDVARRIIEDLNTVAGTSFDAKRNHEARTLIGARMREGATEDDFMSVHRKMWAQWEGTKWQRYMRPSTLYKRSKFDEYLGSSDAGRNQQGAFDLDDPIWLEGCDNAK